VLYTLAGWNFSINSSMIFTTSNIGTVSKRLSGNEDMKRSFYEQVRYVLAACVQVVCQDWSACSRWA